jgi:hypothetical protein
MEDLPSRPARSPLRTPVRRERRIIAVRLNRRWGRRGSRPGHIGQPKTFHPRPFTGPVSQAQVSVRQPPESSFRSTERPPMSPSVAHASVRRGRLSIAVISTVVEWYDFTLSQAWGVHRRAGDRQHMSVWWRGRCWCPCTLVLHSS